MALKGKARPVPVFRPMGSAARARSAAPASGRELVGRAAEGAQFDAWLADC